MNTDDERPPTSHVTLAGIVVVFDNVAHAGILIGAGLRGLTGGRSSPGHHPFARHGSSGTELATARAFGLRRGRTSLRAAAGWSCGADQPLRKRPQHHRNTCRRTVLARAEISKALTGGGSTSYPNASNTISAHWFGTTGEFPVLMMRAIMLLFLPFMRELQL